MTLREKPFSSLTVYELYEIARVRESVFVVEQNCPYGELDGRDIQAVHLWYEEDGKILAYCRVLPKGVSYPEVSIGRVLSVRRGEGLGGMIFSAGLRTAQRLFGPCSIRIEAQKYAEGFYEKFGFRRVSGEFLEDGIPHIEMLRTGKDEE